MQLINRFFCDWAEIRKRMKGSGYWFCFTGTVGHHRITGSNSWSAFLIGSMSLTQMPKLKFFFKCYVILTGSKIKCEPMTLAICHMERKQVQLFMSNRACSYSVSVAEPQCPGSEHRQAALTHQKNNALRTGCSSLPPALSLASPRTACKTAQWQRHCQPLSAGWRDWREPVPRLLLTSPTLGVQTEPSQVKQSYSLVWEVWGLEKSGLPPTPPRLTHLRAKS